ncbi:sugar phosphate isomerase/epimerase family protein [Rhabdothermincola sediminis]|uniref:sugar phosphate isomerase/epimerase family protein n=1 Tax=Rhabdothermincola sediminis TaxID=2751370 RepID=UPI001AA06927|nr:sugar phosphate isomerase/epimerase [Rhabdothermincola sediminis]
MHPRVSVSQVSSWNWSLDEDLAFYEEAGIESVGVAYHKLAATGDPIGAAERVVRTGLRVTNLLVPGPFTLAEPQRWPAQREMAGVVMDTALALRPEVVVFTTGPAGDLTWERAADALAEAMRGTIAEAEREGLLLLLEHTNPLRTDVGFVHTLRDAIDLGWRLDMGVCMELNACWAERNLEGTIGAGIDAIHLVQVSDYAIGTHRTPDRLVPGDGDMPLRRIIRQLLDAGYRGVFDLEIVGPRIEEEGYRSAIARSVAWLDELLSDLLDGLTPS